MPQSAWSSKRERQYEHIKEGLLERGTKEDKAEEIAARTVNKERARAGKRKSRAGRRPRTSLRVGEAVFGPIRDRAAGPGISSTTRPRRRTSRAVRR